MVVPISIVSKSIKQTKDGDTQFSHKFQVVYAFKDEFYTGDQALTIGDPTPPPGFTSGGGPVVLNPPAVITPITDPSIPPAVRELTTQEVQSFKQAVSWGNHAAAGYLSEQLATGKYAPKSYFDDIIAASEAPPVEGTTQLLAVRLKR